MHVQKHECMCMFLLTCLHVYHVCRMGARTSSMPAYSYVKARLLLSLHAHNKRVLSQRISPKISSYASALSLQVCMLSHKLIYAYGLHRGTEDEADIILELDGNQGGGEGEAVQTLSREGDLTRYTLMMQREHLQHNSFLEYHVVCLEVSSSSSHLSAHT